MNRRSDPATIVLLAALAASSAARAVAETVTFRFAPPANASYLARKLEITEIRVGANRDPLTLASLESMRVRQEAGSVYIASKLDKIAAAKDGKAFEVPPAVNAMLGSEIVRVFRPDGTLLRVNGYERLAAKALPNMTGETRRAFEQYVAEGRQDDRDQAAWFEVEALLDQTLELDRDYWFDAAWPDESGWVLHQTLLRLGPWVEHPQGRLLTVNLAYVKNAPAALPGAIQIVPKVRSRLEPREPGRIGEKLKLEGASTWLIDPATAVVWKLQSRRKVSEPVRVNESLGVTVVSEEKIEMTLEPAAPATQTHAKP